MRSGRLVPVLRGRIEPCDPVAEETALRRFVEGMAALATQLLLDGALDGMSQLSAIPATYEKATMAA
jgi:hypothetical protein